MKDSKQEKLGTRVLQLPTQLSLIKIVRNVEGCEKTDKELLKDMAETLYYDWKDLCVYPTPCLNFLLYLDGEPIHGRSWTKHFRNTGFFLHKGCMKYVLNHRNIVVKCPLKQTNRLEDFKWEKRK